MLINIDTEKETAQGLRALAKLLSEMAQSRDFTTESPLAPSDFATSKREVFVAPAPTTNDAAELIEEIAAVEEAEERQDRTKKPLPEKPAEKLPVGIQLY